MAVKNLKPSAYYEDESARFPGRSAPDYREWHAQYMKRLFDAFGGQDVQFDEKKVPISRLSPYALPINESRVKTYRDMLRAGERLPPLVVEKQPDGSYQILDGSHRYHAAQHEGQNVMNAIVVSRSPATGKPGKKYWLRSGDGFSIPSSKSPDRADWDAKYMERVKDFFGSHLQYRPFNAALTDLEGTHSVMSGHPRTDFYARMYRQGERVPPVVVSRMANGKYSVIDGNRRIGSAQMANVSHIPAVEMIDPKRPLSYDEPMTEGVGDPDPDPFGTGAPPKKRRVKKDEFPYENSDIGHPTHDGKGTVTKEMVKSERRGVPQGYGEWVKHPKLPDRIQAIFDAVRDPEVLVERTEDGQYLRKPEYRNHPNRFAGHCYASTEALYHLMNGKETGWKVRRGYHEGDTHWWLYHPRHDVVLDPTAEQFKKPVPYGKLRTRDGRGTDGGFLTKEPSKRASVIMERALKKLGPKYKLQKSSGFASPPPGAFLKGAAFRHRKTGEIVFTGAWHDIDALPNGGAFDPSPWEDGFVGHDGKFYDRTEAAAAVEAPHVGGEVPYLESQDYAEGARTGVYKDEYVGELHRDDKGRFIVKDEFKKRLIDPNEGYTFSHKAFNDGTYLVTARDRNGKTVGYANLGPSAGGAGLSSHMVEVKTAHRRKGVASAMYAHIEKVTGQTVYPSTEQTRDGRAFWEGNRGLRPTERQFGPTKKSEAPLEKAIDAIPAGRVIAQDPTTGRALYDYSHILHPFWRKQGVQMTVATLPKTKSFTVSVYRPNGKSQELIGVTSGNWRLHNNEPGINVHSTSINDDQWRGKKFGVAMYEAMLAHGKHVLGATHVYGDVHSTAASHVHSALAKKHGLAYRRQPNIGGELYHSREDWAETPDHDFDGKYKPYEYVIKSEQGAQAVSVVVEDPFGNMLWGLRQKGGWTLPGGHMEDGETPAEAAAREMQEECGLTPLFLEEVGSSQTDGGIPVHVFRAVAHGTPHSKNDPDNEVSQWRWAPMLPTLPADITSNLAHKRNVALQLLGYQTGM